ncbi:MAG: hypothetical protein GY770_12215 [Aestuariibacter sp.]|nr:hypothetical protein [Bacteroidota bacterium]MCP4234329.1 hypothetical protein [Aestuariibacter sp.]
MSDQQERLRVRIPPSAVELQKDLAGYTSSQKGSRLITLAQSMILHLAASGKKNSSVAGPEPESESSSESSIESKSSKERASELNSMEIFPDDLLMGEE